MENNFIMSELQAFNSLSGQGNAEEALQKVVVGPMLMNDVKMVIHKLIGGKG